MTCKASSRSVNNTGDPTTIVPPATIDAITASLHAAFNRAPVSLTPAGTDWSSMTVPFNPINDDLPGTGGTPVKIEITERQPLGPQVRLLSGHLPVATPVPAPAAGTGQPGDRQPAATLQVVMTRQTAATFGLHAGSEFVMPGSELASTGVVTPVTVLVTGIVAPVDPASSFWGIDPGVLAADLQFQADAPTPYWAAGVMVGPDEAGELQSYFGSRNPRMEWVFPLDVSSLDGQQVQPLSDALDKIGTQTPTLSGPLAPVAATLTASSSMLFSLNMFIATAQSVDTLLWLLYVSLTVAGLAVLLLAARMVAMRRSAEITVIRARGGSLRQIAVGTGRDAALLCVPAAVIAAVLAILVVPGAGSAQGAGSAGGWWPPIAVVAVAVLGPALIAAWQHRLPRRRTAVPRRQRAGTRLVIEAALVAASVAGIVVFRDQGAQAGSGVNLYTSSAPVLVAIPAVIVVLRLYPLVLRGLLRAAARSSRAPAFLGLARASRTAPYPGAARVRPCPRAHRGGLRRHGARRGDQRRGRGVLADGRRGRDGHPLVRGAELHHLAGRRPGGRRRARRDARGRGHERVLDHPGRPPGQRPGRGPRQLRRACRRAPPGSRRCRPGCWRRQARRGRPSPSWCPRKPRHSSGLPAQAAARSRSAPGRRPFSRSRSG